MQLSLSRLNHRLPGYETHPEVVQRTAEFHHQIADALLPQADAVFDDTTTLDTAVDMLDAQPAVVQRLIGSLLFPCQLAVYLHPADKYYRLTRRPSQGQKGLEERAIMASQWPSHPW